MIKHAVKTVWAAARYFLFGLAVAVLYAPRSGSDSRKMMRDSVMSAFDRVLPTSLSVHHQDVSDLDKQEYWEKGRAPQEHPVL